MKNLVVPSGLELTPTGLFIQLAKLTPEDVAYIFEAKHAKPFRGPVGELLGKAFSGLYTRRRQEVAGTRVDFWKLRGGSFRGKFTKAAVNARMHGLDPEMLVLRAEQLAMERKMTCYPPPALVCGDYVFSEILNGWTAGGDDPAPPDSPDDIPAADVGEKSWIFQPGYHWCPTAAAFVRDDDR